MNKKNIKNRKFIFEPNNQSGNYIRRYIPKTLYVYNIKTVNGHHWSMDDDDNDVCE